MQPNKPANDSGYLEAAARIIFMGGLNRQVVDNKWPGFRSAFHDFDIAVVADMSPANVDRLATDDRLIKYRAKLKAIVDNAQAIRRLATDHGSFAAYVDALFSEHGVDGAATALAADFAYISTEGARNWLYSTGYDIGSVTEKVARKYAPYVAPTLDVEAAAGS
jgi:3-methyladenine DNA glycosylase Tag